MINFNFKIQIFIYSHIQKLNMQIKLYLIQIYQSYPLHLNFINNFKFNLRTIVIIFINSKR